MINSFNFEKFDDVYLITNDLGKYCFLTENDFVLLTKDRITPGHELYSLLKENFFIYDEHPEVFLSRITEPARRSKSYLFQSTSLFIFVVTNICNAACIYCQAQDNSSKCHGKMSISTAEKAVDIALSSPAVEMDFEFQGGEPLVNFDVIKHIVLYSEKKAKEKNKNISYSLVSNLTLLNGEIIEFLKEHGISVSTSIDGDPNLHNMNRPMIDGTLSFEKVISKYKELIANGIRPGAIETTTRHTLNRYKELIDTYVKLGLESIFIRPLTPLGIARENWDIIGYSPEEFVEFYDKCLRYLIEINKHGTFISEGHARIFLRKIISGIGINYMELRSPCGASVGQIAYYYDGRVFTCDEGRMLAEMGNDAFMLGTVESTYDELIENPACKAACAASLLETIPSCCDCPYMPYCGTCPVVNLALEGDIFPRSSNNYRCKIYKGMLTSIFRILKENDLQTIEIMKKWIGISDCQQENGG